jgi:hypothetical protein
MHIDAHSTLIRHSFDALESRNSTLEEVVISTGTVGRESSQFDAIYVELLPVVMNLRYRFICTVGPTYNLEKQSCLSIRNVHVQRFTVIPECHLSTVR